MIAGDDLVVAAVRLSDAAQDAAAALGVAVADLGDALTIVVPPDGWQLVTVTEGVVAADALVIAAVEAQAAWQKLLGRVS